MSESLRPLLGSLFRSHPWHGVPIGEDAPQLVTVYIELVPTDTVKYELDKETGLLKVDRPQKYSNVCPTLYGLIPRTLCGERLAERCIERTGRGGIIGDGDALDICVLTEKTIPHGDILLRALPIGGFRMIDGEEADDKIVAVMDGDAAYGSWDDVSACSGAMLDRLRHYFLTYKDLPDHGPRNVEIAETYGRAEAHEVIRRSREDYDATYGNLEARLSTALGS